MQDIDFAHANVNNRFFDISWGEVPERGRRPVQSRNVPEPVPGKAARILCVLWPNNRAGAFLFRPFWLAAHSWRRFRNIAPAQASNWAIGPKPRQPKPKPS